ncbi:hypothetical protein BXZ70DRAFT_903926 [Cristinia sonorae]|uniref:Uncharacterized protein n=1 Tax=Cristinia sonorae TaxID=1940300 RepID=A0A8K0XUG9_9AGAR|nr:hypothetical protein BXZ70DRAFT_903926 [Cristinia sonorae]
MAYISVYCLIQHQCYAPPTSASNSHRLNGDPADVYHTHIDHSLRMIYSHASQRRVSGVTTPFSTTSAVPIDSHLISPKRCFTRLGVYATDRRPFSMTRKFNHVWLMLPLLPLELDFKDRLFGWLLFCDSLNRTAVAMNIFLRLGFAVLLDDALAAVKTSASTFLDAEDTPSCSAAETHPRFRMKMAGLSGEAPSFRFRRLSEDRGLVSRTAKPPVSPGIVLRSLSVGNYPHEDATAAANLIPRHIRCFMFGTWFIARYADFNLD